ncbi:M3 family oligoendopeptidase [Clostridium senegalense]|uniref:M3 family oligoendopeptidase n=1 Tax=Clostridium senegalense TaxID=1465809 RepID=UPI001C0FA9C9|nr:M3 family oligoendopeptidase [Clostridium senegalense]MBU5225067.1 M3 family oligoendopeptidase [Clostridium senegalense]
MDMKWDLDRIYTSFDSEKFKSDINSLNEYVTIINEWASKNFISINDATSKLEKFLKLTNEYKSLYLRLYCYAYLLISVDAENKEAMDMLDEIAEKNDELTKSSIIFIKWLNNINNLDDIICSSPYISEHKSYLYEIYSKSKNMLSENEENLIVKMQSTGSRAWQKLYMAKMSSTKMNIEINGEIKEISFAELKNMAYEKDLALRKFASEEEKKACKEIAQTISFCINEISGEAINICDIKGYESVINKVLIESKMDNKILNVMTEVIKDKLPMFHKYYAEKGKLLGHKHTVPFYDIYAPIGNENGKISYEDSKNLIISSFKTFSDELSNFAKRVFEENWVDAEPTATKGNYAISIDIFPIKESRIMTNFSGNYVDVTVLAHEIGHAYHSYCLREEELLNTDYPTPIAETASIFCETIINKELIKKVKLEDKIIMLERSISDTAYYIVEMYGRFLFECELFDKRKIGRLSVDELNEMMKKHMKLAYGSIIDENTINSYSWVTNIGFYMAGNEFLNFPYIFGVLFSKGLYAKYLNNKKDFVVRYNKFLRATNKNKIFDMAKVMDIDIYSQDFWEGAFNVIKKDIDEFISGVNKL